MSQSIQCISCARYRGLGECAAFPNGIPGEILTGEFDHEQPYGETDGDPRQSDGGFQFVHATYTSKDEKFAWPETK